MWLKNDSCAGIARGRARGGQVARNLARIVRELARGLHELARGVHVLAQGMHERRVFGARAWRRGRCRRIGVSVYRRWGREAENRKSTPHPTLSPIEAERAKGPGEPDVTGCRRIGVSALGANEGKGRVYG